MWKVLATRDLLNVPNRLRVTCESLELPDGRRVSDYLQIAVPSFSIVVAETFDQKLLFLQQYRHGIREITLELVGGELEVNEEPLEAARRELLEESGFVSQQWSFLGKISMSSTHGWCSGFVFHAAKALFQQKPSSTDLEDPTLLLLTRPELKASMKMGRVSVASTLAALALADI
jgi:ADP-ribose pyrophosphatase